MLAKNAAGLSTPSSVVGPVKVSRVTFVDELADFSKVHSRSGELGLESRDCRSGMEDAHRASGQAGSALVCRMASPIKAAKVFVFFPKETADLKFSVSTDGRTFQPAIAQRKVYPFNAVDYGYWQRAIYKLKPTGKRDRFVKIEFTGPAQIARVEIQHEAVAR